MIQVTKSFLPDFQEYTKYLKQIWSNGQLTNNGPLVKELELRLKNYLGVKHLLFTGNGTIVLQMALKVFGITKEVLTTPFSYVATTNALLWEGCTPVFVDINRRNFCIDADKIEEKITANTQAILATHVFGYPCDIDRIERIALKHNLKVIYDGAHGFSASLNGKSLLSFGDVSSCSFHSTKLFHTIEGGCIVTSDDKVADQLDLFRQFGHRGDDYFTMGINAKNSEFHAAMGLCVLPRIDEIILNRKRTSKLYDDLLKDLGLIFPQTDPGLIYNYAYYAVIFPSEAEVLRVKSALAHEQIFPRRYFYPSLNKLPFVSPQPMPVSEEIAQRVLSLPLSHEMTDATTRKICDIIKKARA